jgi:hypothetical protein
MEIENEKWKEHQRKLFELCPAYRDIWKRIEGYVNFLITCKQDTIATVLFWKLSSISYLFLESWRAELWFGTSYFWLRYYFRKFSQGNLLCFFFQFVSVMNTKNSKKNYQDMLLRNFQSTGILQGTTIINFF